MKHRKALRVSSGHYHTYHLVSFMAAKEKGFFTEEGLTEEDLDLIHPGGLVPSMVERVALYLAMKERAIDIVTDCKVETVLYQNSIGVDLYIIGGWNNNLRREVVIGSKGMKSLKDVKGKRMSTRDLGGKGHTFSRFVFKRAGLDPERDIQWVRGVHSVTESPEALKSGKVDAVHARDTARDLLEKEGYPILADSRNYYPEGLPARLVVATGQVLKGHPDLVKAFLRGMIRGYWQYRDPANFEFIKDVELRMRQIAWDEEERDLERNMNYMNRNPALLEESPFPINGSVSRKGLEIYLEEVKGDGVVPANYQLDKALRLDLVEEAFRELSARPELESQLEKAREIAKKYLI